MNRPAIQVPGHARGICRSCKAAVIWVKTVNGKSMPLDLEEMIGKGLVLFTIDAKGVAHRAPEGTPGRESHFSTCIDGPSWRKSQVSCVPTCPVRTAAGRLLGLYVNQQMAAAIGTVDALESINETDWHEAVEQLDAGLAAPCLGPPATDFDRAEFDALLKEVVALREWKAAQERVLYGPPAAPSEAGIRPRIVCLCGSSRFVAEMAVIAWELERDEGYIALGLHLVPRWYTTVDDHLAEEQGVAEKMDALHLRKIDLADQVLVVNVGGYIGDSTRREIAYAHSLGKSVRYLEPVEAERGAPPPEASKP